MKKISLLLLGLIWAIGLAASHQAILAVADSLLASGEYYAAITEFKRFVSYESPNPVSSAIHLKIALASREIGDFRGALRYADKAVYAAETDSLRASHTIEKAIILMNAGNPSLAEFILFREAHTGRFASVRERASALLGLNYILQSKWPEAVGAISDFATLKGMEADAGVLSLLELLNANSQAGSKDPKLSRRLSTWLPGLGQFYCGDWRNGVNSLVINAAIVWWFVDSALKGQLVKLVPIAFLGWKFYQGGRARAALIAEGKNRELQADRVRSATELYGALLEGN